MAAQVHCSRCPCPSPWSGRCSALASRTRPTTRAVDGADDRASIVPDRARPRSTGKIGRRHATSDGAASASSTWRGRSDPRRGGRTWWDGRVTYETKRMADGHRGARRPPGQRADKRGTRRKGRHFGPPGAAWPRRKPSGQRWTTYGGVAPNSTSVWPARSTPEVVRWLLVLGECR